MKWRLWFRCTAEHYTKGRCLSFRGHKGDVHIGPHGSWPYRLWRAW